MKNQKRFALCIASLIISVLFSGSLIAQPHILPTITGESGSAKVLNIQIDSNRKEVQMLAMQAFNVHGYYKLVKSRADFVFNINLDNSGISVSILSGATNTVKKQEVLPLVGGNWIESTLRACDRLVLLTSGRPGFFAGQILSVGNKTGKNEVYRSDLFFQQVVQLTNHQSNTLGPAWSPDGTSVLYTSYYKSGFPDIMKIDLARNQVRGFATYKGTNTGAAYSPEGKRVAMILSSSGNPELYISDSEGKNLFRVTSNKSLESAPAWSPDGRRIVLSSNQPGKPQLYVVSPLPKAHMSLIHTNVSSYCAEPSWNPVNPDKIVFTVAISSGFQVAVYDFAAKKSEVLTKGGADGIEPVWTNDGRHVIFTRRDSAGKQLCVLDVETKQVMPLHDKKFGSFSQADFLYLK
jgi:TolB protein